MYSSDTLTKRGAVILKICPPAIITSAEVIIAEYDAILGQWERKDFYNHLSNYTNNIYSFHCLTRLSFFSFAKELMIRSFARIQCFLLVTFDPYLRIWIFTFKGVYVESATSSSHFTTHPTPPPSKALPSTPGDYIFYYERQCPRGWSKLLTLAGASWTLAPSHNHQFQVCESQTTTRNSSVTQATGSFTIQYVTVTN